MGLSLGVLAALVLLLPGIAFAFALTKLHSQGKPTAKPFDQHFSPVLVVAIVSAFMLHVVATFVWNGLFAQTVRIEPGLVLPLLAGDLDTDAGKQVIASVSQYSLREGLYFFAITFAGLGFGKFANQFFRERHAATWYSLLHPKDADFIWLTADIKLDDECYLIAGVVNGIQRQPGRETRARSPARRHAAPAALRWGRTPKGRDRRWMDPDPGRVHRGPQGARSHDQRRLLLHRGRSCCRQRVYAEKALIPARSKSGDATIELQG